MNVLIYSGSGSVQGLTRNLVKFLSKLLGERYAISTISSKELSEDPWVPSTKLLILPEGWEPPYIPNLSSHAKLKIIDFVTRGGKFVGLCAERYEPYTHNHPMPSYPTYDHLAFGFFPGKSYDAPLSAGNPPETGIDSVTFTFPFLNNDNAPINCPTLYSQGGYFVDAEAHTNTTVLAIYGVGKKPSRSAAVLCQVGSNGGQALLSYVHPEHVLNPKFATGGHSDDTAIFELVFSRWLQQLGLILNTEPIALRITPITLSHLDRSSSIPLSNKTKSTLQQVYQDLLRASSSHSGLLEDKSRISIKWYGDDEKIWFNAPQQDSANNLTIVGCPDPARILGVTFRPARYLKCLEEAYAKSWLVKHDPNIPLFGVPILYGELVTSTQSLLIENPKLRQHLSPGAVFVAGRQIAAKGRGKNSWVSPLGCCQFSCYLEHPMFNASTSPILIQFLGSLAVVEALRQKPGYEGLALHIKWPNDIYGIDYSDAGNPVRKKVGGILLSSFYDGGSLALILGVGINVTNQHPTMCVNDLVDQLNRNRRAEPPLPPFSQEEVAARILAHFHALYTEFMSLAQGFGPFLDRYYACWLHSRELVTLADRGNVPARILGITPEFGLLHVVSVDPATFEVNPLTTQHFELQPDGNSFDLMTGMISQKVR